MESKDVVPEGRCAFYIERKRRHCRFRPSSGQKYCAEHAGLLGIELEKKRIPCPLNPKHTCYESKLAKHLKKCKNRPGILPPYHCAGINSGSGDEPDTKLSFSDIPLSELEKYIERINELYSKYIKDVEKEILTHECLIEELNNETYGIQAIRHRKQQASLIGHLDKMGLLDKGHCYVEMGAGKGGLSHWIQKATSDCEDVSFLLIDRSHVRYKFDNLHKWEDNEPKFERLRIDIADLDLSKVESVCKGDKSVVAVGKHLCGCATDLALRCLINGINIDSLKVESNEPPVKRSKEDEHSRLKLGGLNIALCCHHRCTWSSYVGKKFFTECGLKPNDFQILVKLTGWAVGNWKGWKTVNDMQTDLSEKSELANQNTTSIVKDMQKDIIDKSVLTNQDGKDLSEKSELASQNTTNTVKDMQKDIIDKSVLSNQDACTKSSHVQTTESTAVEQNLEIVSHQSQADAMSTGESSFVNKEVMELEHKPAVSWKRSDLKLTDEERETIGWKCKRLIDYGRVCFLREHGFCSDLKIYIDHKLTPENVAIYALPSDNNS